MKYLTLLFQGHIWARKGKKLKIGLNEKGATSQGRPNSKKLAIYERGIAVVGDKDKKWGKEGKEKVRRGVSMHSSEVRGGSRKLRKRRKKMCGEKNERPIQSCGTLFGGKGRTTQSERDDSSTGRVSISGREPDQPSEGNKNPVEK